MMHRLMIVWVLVAVCTGCSGSPKHFDDPIATLMDRTEAHRNRWAAAEQAEREMADHPDRIRALQKLVWMRGHGDDYSHYAIDQLLAIDEAQTRKFLASAIVLTQDWDTVQYIINLAVERQWRDFVPALVRNYARPSPRLDDADRPERQAIEQLAPDRSAEQTVFDVFAADVDADIRQRTAAWILLHRLVNDREKMIALLSDTQADDPLILDLRAAARDLSIVPDSRETILWLQRVRAEHQTLWDGAVASVQQLTPQQREGLQLRHLPVLTWLKQHHAAVLQMPAESLRAEITALLAGREHYLKGPNYDGPMQDHPQRFGDWRDQLAWPDLAVIFTAIKLMDDRRLVDAWFRRGDADLMDPLTEYGGLVRIDAEGVAQVYDYPPIIRQHDLKYVPPAKLVHDAYAALAHYHFHAQEYDNRRYAGPGIGDLRRIAQQQQFNALVLTFVDGDTFNVDVYFNPDVVVDLGTVRR